MNWLDLSEHQPRLHEQAWLAGSATLVGDVTLAAGASVWFNAVLRADGDSIEIGEDTNIQDGCVLHADPGVPIRLGRGVSVGHRAVLHGCVVEDNVLVGMGAVIMNGARVGRGSIIGWRGATGEHGCPSRLTRSWAARSCQAFAHPRGAARHPGKRGGLPGTRRAIPPG